MSHRSPAVDGVRGELAPLPMRRSRAICGVSAGRRLPEEPPSPRLHRIHAMIMQHLAECRLMKHASQMEESTAAGSTVSISMTRPDIPHCVTGLMCTLMAQTRPEPDPNLAAPQPLAPAGMMSYCSAVRRLRRRRRHRRQAAAARLSLHTNATWNVGMLKACPLSLSRHTGCAAQNSTCQGVRVGSAALHASRKAATDRTPLLSKPSSVGIAFLRPEVSEVRTHDRMRD